MGSRALICCWVHLPVLIHHIQQCFLGTVGRHVLGILDRERRVVSFLFVVSALLAVTLRVRRASGPTVTVALLPSRLVVTIGWVFGGLLSILSLCYSPLLDFRLVVSEDLDTTPLVARRSFLVGDSLLRGFAIGARELGPVISDSDIGKPSGFHLSTADLLIKIDVRDEQPVEENEAGFHSGTPLGAVHEEGSHSVHQFA